METEHVEQVYSSPPSFNNKQDWDQLREKEQGQLHEKDQDREQLHEQKPEQDATADLTDTVIDGTTYLPDDDDEGDDIVPTTSYGSSYVSTQPLVPTPVPDSGSSDEEGTGGDDSHVQERPEVPSLDEIKASAEQARAEWDTYHQQDTADSLLSQQSAAYQQSETTYVDTFTQDPSIDATHTHDTVDGTSLPEAVVESTPTPEPLAEDSSTSESVVEDAPTDEPVETALPQPQPDLEDITAEPPYYVHESREEEDGEGGESPTRPSADFEADSPYEEPPPPPVRALSLIHI